MSILEHIPETKAEPTEGSPLQGLTTEIITITPDEAAAMLETNLNNRKIRDKKVDQFAKSMRMGEWVVNGEALKFNKAGKLVDGQHRLWACVVSGVAFSTLVVRGVADEAQTSMDQGSSRSLADTLRWRGESNVHQLSSLVRLMAHFFEKGIITSSQAEIYTKNHLLRVLEENPDLRESMHFPQSKSNIRLLTPSVTAALYFLFSKVDKEDADEFFWRLGTAQGLEEGSPILALRRALEKNRDKPHSKMTARHLSAIAIKAWNAWRKGDTLKVLSWKPGGKTPEGYPRIHGFEYQD